MSRSLGNLLWSCSALTVGLILAAPAAAQQTDKMSKDTAMMSHDSMGADSMAMEKDKMGMEKDKMGMEKGKMGMEKGKMGMAPHAMMMGSKGNDVGTVTVKSAGGKSEIQFGDDFSMTGANDVEVVLSRSDDAAAEGAIKLGKLKKASGAQSYKVPSGTSLSEYSHVILWSTKDKAAVGTASLAASGDAMHK